MRGADKLLQPVGDRPLLRRIAERALATSFPVVVALPGRAPSRRAALDGLPVTLVEVPDAALGMSRSLACGVGSVMATAPGPSDGIMVLPADMPGFTTAALADLCARFQGEPTLIWRGGTGDGQPGHPAIFPRDLWSDLTRIEGDEGGRSILSNHKDRVRVHFLPDDMATLDLDTPEDWAAFRLRSAGSA